MTIFRENRDLLLAFRDGGRKALEEVYWQYIDLVVTVVRRGSMGFNYDEQRDLVQETFSRTFAVKTRLAFDGIHDYRPFLMAICRNVMVDAFRRRGREVPVDLTTGDADGLAIDAEDISDAAWADPGTVAVF